MSQLHSANYSIGQQAMQVKNNRVLSMQIVASNDEIP